MTYLEETSRGCVKSTWHTLLMIYYSSDDVRFTFSAMEFMALHNFHKNTSGPTKIKPPNTHHPQKVPAEKPLDGFSAPIRLHTLCHQMRG